MSRGRPKRRGSSAMGGEAAPRTEEGQALEGPAQEEGRGGEREETQEMIYLQYSGVLRIVASNSVVDSDSDRQRWHTWFASCN